MVLTERDRLIIKTVCRFRFMLGRQIKALCGFSGTRATDRRLNKLINYGLLKRSRVLYGVAGLYQITDKAKKILSIDLPVSKIRIEQIEHDIFVIDTAIYFIRTRPILLSYIITEKQSRHEQGFTTRGHEPDFTFTHKDKNVCVEVELNLKAKKRYAEIIKRNFVAFDTQIWFIPKEKTKIRETVEKLNIQYPNIEIMELERVQEFINDM
jgi:hypothetical protein